MSGRICTVHGEWCPDGICRWCEEPAAKAKAARMQVLSEAFALADWRLNLRAPPSWRIEYRDRPRLAAANAAEQSRLDTQHAALRWERLERRWATKHGRWTMLDVANHWQTWFELNRRSLSITPFSAGDLVEGSLR